MKSANDNVNPKGAADSRCAATFIDCFVIVLAMIPASPVLDVLDAVGSPSWLTLSVCVLVWVAAAIGTLSAFESSRLRGSPGKLACGIRVLSADGSRASFRQALRRNLTKYSLSLFGLVPVARSGWNPAGSVHDLAAGTMVVPSGGIAA